MMSATLVGLSIEDEDSNVTRGSNPSKTNRKPVKLLSDGRLSVRNSETKWAMLARKKPRKGLALERIKNQLNETQPRLIKAVDAPTKAEKRSILKQEIVKYSEEIRLIAKQEGCGLKKAAKLYANRKSRLKANRRAQAE